MRELEDCHARVDVHDPWADPDEARDEYGYELVAEPEEGATTPSCWPSRTSSCARSVPPRCAAGVARTVLFDLKSVFERTRTCGSSCGAPVRWLCGVHLAPEREAGAEAPALEVVERKGLEPSTFALRTRRSTN